jgi:protein phosphatase
MEYSANTDIGNYREKNEDFYYCDKNLFIVADGMGGHAAGEVASTTAVNSFVEYFFSNLKKPDKNQTKEILKSSLEYANSEVYRLATEKNDYNGMGTTFTACFITKKMGFVIHVGDSRLYLRDKKEFKLLTEDQTVVGEMYRNGLITYDEMFNHPLRNYLNNVLGLSSDLDSDFFEFNLSRDNIIMLCSDGLNSMLKDDHIKKIIDGYTVPEDITDNLIKSALKKGGFDNITVITIKI